MAGEILKTTIPNLTAMPGSIGGGYLFLVNIPSGGSAGTYKLTATELLAWAQSGLLASDSVVDVLTSISSTAPLSAGKGKTLKDLIDALTITVGLKLDASTYVQHFKGKHVSLVALQTAYPTASDGDYAVVDAGGGSAARNYIWDAQAGWVDSGAVVVSTTTDEITEGSTNQYFTVARVRAVVLTGLSLATNAAITASDTVLAALGKLQKQITDLPNMFLRYDAAQSLSDAQKSQLLANAGAKKSYNMLTKTASYALQLADFKDAVDLYDKVYLRMNLTAIGDVTIGTALTSLPNLTEISVRDLGTARATLVESGTVLNGIKTFTVQNEVKTLVKVGANEWDIIGALT